MPENEDKRPAGCKLKTEYGHAAISSGSGIEFVVCDLGGEQLGGKEEAKLYEDKEPTGEDLVDYVGYLGHVEDLIVTEPIEVAEDPVTVVADEKDQWVLVAKQSGRESKAITKKAARMKMKDKKVGCARVQSHNGRVSEVSCENCTHTAIAAKKKGCYTQRDSGGVWTTPEMSGQGSRWDTKGMYEGENTAVI